MPLVKVWGNAPRPPFWPQNVLNGSQRPKKKKNQNRNKPQIYIYTNFKVKNSMATLFFEHFQNSILFKV